MEGISMRKKEKTKRLICPACNGDITSMEPNLIKKFHRWYCKCGRDCTKIKLHQFIESFKYEGLENRGADSVSQ